MLWVFRMYPALERIDMTITLTREEAQQVLDALDEYRDSTEDFRVANRCISLMNTLRARFALHDMNQAAEQNGEEL